MKTFWVCFLLQSLQIFAELPFGTPDWHNPRLCKQWSCINTKLGLPNSLPPREQYDIALRSMLPDGEWQEVVNEVLDACYRKRARVYTNSCPGQALLECTVENLINNCPKSSRRKNDACSPIHSFAGKHMFFQSIYADIKKNGPYDSRLFLRYYFNMTCCNLPPLFNTSTLAECQFRSVVNYYRHAVRRKPFGSTQTLTTASPEVSTIDNPDDNSVQDPLDCCDMSDFIQPSWRSECDFKLSWDPETRLTVTNSTSASTVPPPTTTTAAQQILRDVKIVPVSSENLTCVFNKLNMLTEMDDVNLELFVKLLDNYTKDHEEFTKAKARVITKCLTKPLLTFDGVTHIEKVVACTLDLLSENCPYYNKKNDTCRNPTAGMVCQISSSRYRAKTRRTLCSLPNLVPDRFLNECGINSLSRMEYVLQKITTVKKYGHIHTKIGFDYSVTCVDVGRSILFGAVKKPESLPPTTDVLRLHERRCHCQCLDASESTTCLMKKMAVLNKYDFVDYFKMKDRIRRYTNEPTWSTFTSWSNIYLSAFLYPPLYGGHCNSPKKLLNVIDSMLMTCPIAKRRSSQFCNQIFGNTSSSHF